jgi:hypothetical protein
MAAPQIQPLPPAEPPTEPTRAAPAPVSYAGLTPNSEEAIARFDAAHDGFEPDQALLGGTPARSLAEAMAEMVSSLKRIDIDRVSRKQGWWSRFTGADLEARIELEIAATSLGKAMQRMARLAAAARNAREAMRADLPVLDAAQLSHQALADTTAAFLRGSDVADPVVARLQRRLANLEALHAANRLIRAQMVMAIDHLSGLLDRFSDIEQLLFPVWQRHALSIAQGMAGAESQTSVLEQLKAIHARFHSALLVAKD